MIGFRDGHTVILCDGCYRPKRSGEQGWQHSDEGGLPATSSLDATDPRGRARTGVSPEMGLDYCPDVGCVQAQVEARLARLRVPAP